MQEYYKLLIGGKWQDSVSGKRFSTYNPANGEKIAEVAEAGVNDVDKAVKAARDAFDNGEWSHMAPSERRKTLLCFASLIEKNKEELVRIDAMDVGKPIRDTLEEEIPAIVDIIQYYAGWCENIMGETIPVSEKLFNYTVREPRGVVAIITPWNYPLAESIIQWAPALACGNTIVAKPAEQDPLGPIMLGRLAYEAGIPDGVVNVLAGVGPDAGAALASHPQVDMIAFTGSTATGKKIMNLASDTMKHLSFQLGGKAPCIIFSDADLDAAIYGVLKGAYLHQGQICECTTRLLLEDTIYEEFLNRLTEKVKTLRIGDPMDMGTSIGALITPEHLKRVEGYVDTGIKEGARLHVGGKRPEGQQFQKGNFYLPTIFTDVARNMTIFKEEIFGPVLSVTKFSGEEEAIELANDTIYGLMAGLWTEDSRKAQRVSKAIKAGTVAINHDTQIWNLNAPFGGYKQSGFGREFGHYSIENYTQVKHVWMSLDEKPKVWPNR